MICCLPIEIWVWNVFWYFYLNPWWWYCYGNENLCQSLQMITICIIRIYCECSNNIKIRDQNISFHTWYAEILNDGSLSHLLSWIYLILSLPYSSHCFLKAIAASLQLNFRCCSCYLFIFQNVLTSLCILLHTNFHFLDFLWEPKLLAALIFTGLELLILERLISMIENFVDAKFWLIFTKLELLILEGLISMIEKFCRC